MRGLVGGGPSIQGQKSLVHCQTLSPCQPALALPVLGLALSQLVLCDSSTASEKASSSVHVSRGPPSMPCTLEEQAGTLEEQAGTSKKVAWRERVSLSLR